jgi:hypothetical protein
MYASARHACWASSGQISVNVLLLCISCASALGGFVLDNRSGLHTGMIAVTFPLSAQPRNSQNLCDAESGGRRQKQVEPSPSATVVVLRRWSQCDCSKVPPTILCARAFIWMVSYSTCLNQVLMPCLRFCVQQ